MAARKTSARPCNNPGILVPGEHAVATLIMAGCGWLVTRFNPWVIIFVVAVLTTLFLVRILAPRRRR